MLLFFFKKKYFKLIAEFYSFFREIRHFTEMHNLTESCFVGLVVCVFNTRAINNNPGISEINRHQFPLRQCNE